MEALRALKPDEARALLLKAEGLSYDEIGRRFGWTYTKVNRSIAEGRKRFLKVYSGIESGEACAAYEEALDALAAGAATTAQVVSIRPHLRHCSACRATVRQMRFSRTKRLALFAPFAWLSRLLSRPEVVQLTSSGGGRFGPAAGLIGLCLTGAGAGAACVMTGALPAAPIIAQVQSDEPEPRRPTAAATKPKAAKKPVVVVRSKPVSTRVEPPPRVYRALATPTPTPRPAPPRKQATAKRKPVVATKRKRVTEFNFEGRAVAKPVAPAPVVARAANAQDSPPPPQRSGGGGAATSAGGEFGFEGG